MINLNWADSEKKLLIWHFGQQWSRIDFLNACQKSQYMMNSTDHLVNILVDLSASRSYPSNLTYMWLIWMRSHAKKTDKVALISSSQVWSRVSQHIFSVYSIDSLSIDFVDSYSEAVKMLQSPIVDDERILQEQLPTYVAPFVAV